MADNVTVKVDGVQGLMEKLARLRVDANKVEDVLYEGAVIYAEEAKRRAPKGKTGNLKKAIKAKRGKKDYSVKTYRSVFTATDFHKAPHDHLVEFGHDLVRNGKKVGQVKEHPFFRPAVIAKKAEVEKHVVDGLNKLLEEAAK
jgi:HK97 gp10 family phage protein